MHQDPFGEVGGVRQVEPQRGQVEIALLRLDVVAFDAMLLHELSNRPRQVTGSRRSRNSKKKAELNECSHAMKTSRARKASCHSNPCARRSQRHGWAIRQGVSAK